MMFSIDAPRRLTPLLQSAIQQSTEAVLITEGAPLDAPGPRIEYVNPAFTDITGYSPEEVIGKTPRLLQGPDTEPWVLETMRQHLEEGRPFEGEAINYRKDGTPYVNHWSAAPVRDDNETITHWVSVQRDVTSQRRTIERLLRVQEEERHRIAQQMHDEIGGLLTSLQMLVDRAKTEVDRMTEGDFPEACHDVESRIDHLSKVVRILTGQESPRLLDDYGLSEALSRLVAQVEDTEGIDIAFHNEIGADERFSSLLERVVYRVCREALANVSRHADTDRAQVLINKTERQLRLHVIDYGRGFSPRNTPDDRDHLGLRGIRERVEQLNGSFALNTAPGEGTRLTVTLPRSLVALPS
jgi:PAS domain S-box-containing protein